MPIVINYKPSFLAFTLSSQILKLVPHQLTKLLKSLHELFVVTIFCHCFLGIRLKHINCFHVLRVCKQFVYFLIRFHIVQKVVIHPFLSRLIQVIVHLHRLLDLLYFQRVLVCCFKFWNLLLFRFRIGWFGTGSREESFFKASKLLFLFGSDLHFDLFLCIFKVLLLLLELLFVFNVPGVDFGVVFRVVSFFIGFVCDVDSFDLSFEVLKFWGQFVRLHLSEFKKISIFNQRQMSNRQDNNEEGIEINQN